MLLQGSWLPENKRALEDLIARHGTDTSHDPADAPFAVFDWDQTIIKHDIGDALFVHQMERIAFATEHDDFWAMLDEASEVWELRAGVAALRDLAPHEWTSRQEHAAFRSALMLSFLFAAELDPQEGFPWQTRILAGMRPEQVEALTEEVIDAALAAPLEEVVYRVDGHTKEIKFGAGIRPYAEMLDLIKNLEAAGILCWIVSATNVWAVRTFARKLGLSPQRVIGMRTRVVDGIITRELDGPAPATSGKVAAIKHYIHPNRAPVLVAGDNITDLPMLEYSSDMRLIIDRGVTALRHAAEARRVSDKRWLIQPAFDVE